MKNSRLRKDLPISINDRVTLTFREGFIFTQLRICEVSRKLSPRKNFRIYSIDIRKRIYESLHQKVNAGDNLSNSGCTSLFIRQRIQKSPVRQRMQESLYQTADAGRISSGVLCRSSSIRHQMQDSLSYSTGA